ncbi:germacrene-D synthase-like [Forsythia ovata]|uniref:Germacrene-D synthase-like n=1 Tax=Forsythia ovata TaxID=205694 RepID=A0ABD1UZ17_9LAMI
MKKLVRAYFKEAKWTYDGYVPTIEKYMKVALVSGAYMMLSTSSLVGMGELATKEAFEWISSEPLLVRASSIICRLMDDMVGHGVRTTQMFQFAKFEKCKEHRLATELGYGFPIGDPWIIDGISPWP